VRSAVGVHRELSYVVAFTHCVQARHTRFAVAVQAETWGI
jgi:hypothetical protein